MIAKRVIFFTAGALATAAEREQIAALQDRAGAPLSVLIRSGDTQATFGAGGNPEPADYVMGSPPAAYDDVPMYSVPAAGLPDALIVAPDAPNVAHGQSIQLAAVAKDAGGSLHDVSKSVAWATTDASKATVTNAGVVTGVAAGAATIKATVTGSDGSSQTVAQTVVTIT